MAKPGIFLGCLFVYPVPGRGFLCFWFFCFIIVKCQVWNCQTWQGFHLIQIYSQHFGYFFKGFHGTIFCTFLHNQPLFIVGTFQPHHFACKCDGCRQRGQTRKRAVHAGAFLSVPVCWASLADLSTRARQFFPVPRHLVSHELPHVWGHCWPWVPFTFRHLHHLQKFPQVLPGQHPTQSILFRRPFSPWQVRLDPLAHGGGRVPVFC